MRSMIGAIMILVLAWSLGGCCRYLLGTGEFVSGFFEWPGRGSRTFCRPSFFVVAAFIGFAMVRAGVPSPLILPIIIGVFAADDPLFLVAENGRGWPAQCTATSRHPVRPSLSSAGAKCNHLRHVAADSPPRWS